MRHTAEGTPGFPFGTCELRGGIRELSDSGSALRLPSEELAKDPACKNAASLLEAFAKSQDKNSLVSMLAAATVQLEQSRELESQAKWAHA